MINSIMYISWDVSPALYDGFITLRYYSLFFALAFLLGYQLVKKMYLKEDAPLVWMDKLLVYTVVGTIIGARLGHVFFYDWDYYSKNLIEIPMVWKGGLASHGAAIALVVAMWLYSKKVTNKSTMWSLDKLVIAVALAAGFIRVGNLMNSEIVGQRSTDTSGLFYENKSASTIARFFSTDSDKVDFISTDEDTLISGITYPKVFVNIPLGSTRMKSAYANVFASSFSVQNMGEEADFFSGNVSLNYQISPTNELLIPIYVIPRIPTQLWEAFSYWLIFIFLSFGYWKQKWYLYEGRLFGVFMVLLFTARFFIEFYKEHQTLANSSSLTMGQYLSIPLVLVGLFFWIKSKRIDTN
jgi:prolipoprotein diacylglyceryl transferase